MAANRVPLGPQAAPAAAFGLEMDVRRRSRWRERLPLALDLVAKTCVLGLALYPLLDPTSSHFTGKAMGFRAAVYPLATLVIPALWVAHRRPRPYPYLADTAFAIPFAFDAAGNVFGLFAISGFDVLPHSIGWLLISLAFGLAVAPHTDRRSIAAGLTIGFGATVDILWEIGEFAMLKSGSSGLQLTYENTIQDLAMSLMGAVVGGILVATVLFPRPGTPKALFGWQAR